MQIFNYDRIRIIFDLMIWFLYNDTEAEPFHKIRYLRFRHNVRLSEETLF